MHSHDVWEWSISHQKDEGDRVRLTKRPMFYAWVEDIGGMLLCFTNSKRLWWLAHWLRTYWIADRLLNWADGKTRTVLEIPITKEQRKQLQDGEDWFAMFEEDDNAGDS